MLRTRPAFLALFAAAVLAASTLAQPSYEGLSGDSESSLRERVRALTERIAELQRELDRLRHPSEELALSDTGKTAEESALEKLVRDTKGVSDSLKAALDGHHFLDPNDPRVSYWLVKRKAWPKAKEEIDLFAGNMAQILQKSELLTETARAGFVELILWGRGKVLYKAGLSPDQKEVLPVDFGAAVVPVPPRPGGEKPDAR